MTAPRIIALVALVGCAAAGCITKTTTVLESKGMTVQLVSKRGEDIELNHPITIAPVRLSHILARIDLRLPVKKGQQRVPAFDIESLTPISEGLAAGLREAKPNQRVVVYSIRREKRFGIFDENFLTSFIAYVHGEHLFLHLSRSNWEIPPRKKDRLPAPKIGKFPSKFRILPGKAMKLVDEQSLAIAWQDDLFAKPTRTRVTPGGRVVRRTILMESEEPESDAETQAGEAQTETEWTIPAGISAQTLRALADLEERRQRGEIGEADYEREKREILDADPAAGSD